MISKEIVIELYEYFFIKVSGYRNFTFKPKNNDLKTIENFITTIDKEYNLNTLGYNFWFDYFTYAFQQRADQKTRFGKGDIKFNWVIGKKQLEYWKNRGDSYKYFNDLFCEKYGIKRKEEQQDKKQLQEFREREKRRYFNTDEGLINCMELGLKFNVKSINCLKCNYRIHCK